MKRKLEFDWDIRNHLRSVCLNINERLSHAYDQQRHLIVIDMITLTANGDVEKAEDYQELSLRFLNICRENSSACW